MPKRITPLSEVKIRTTKPGKNPYKLFDGGGLFLLVTPSGGKLWNFKYRFDNKEKKLALGPYPEFSLSNTSRGGNRLGGKVLCGVILMSCWVWSLDRPY